MRRMRLPLVSVAIVTWNRRNTVLKALESVFAQPYRPLEVVVVDSASTDGTSEAIEECFPEVRIVRLHRNLGCPEGRNVAIANCKGEIIFFLDDDASLHPSAISLCAERFDREPSLGIIACRVVPPMESPPEDDGEHYTYRFSGGASAARRQIFSESGYFPSDFFRQSEEGDLALRVLDAGYSILYYPSAVVYHPTTNPMVRQDHVLYFGCRNELYTVIRRYPWLCVALGFVWKCAVWNWKGIQMRLVHATVGASITALARTPLLALHRDPVSLATMRLLWTLRAQERRQR